MGAPERMTLDEVAARSGVSRVSVLRIARDALLYRGKGRLGRDVGELLTPALRVRLLTHVTARALADDPHAVLEGAEALAALARRAVAERDGAAA